MSFGLWNRPAFPRRLQRGDDFVVLDLFEAVVELAHGRKVTWLFQADDVVGDGGDPSQAFPGGDRYGADEACRSLFPNCMEGGFHCCSRGDAVVDDDDHAPLGWDASGHGIVLGATHANDGQLRGDLGLHVRFIRPDAKGGAVICAGIHMSDIPSFPYRLLWGERRVMSVANLTRKDGEDFLALAAKAHLRTKVTTYSLAHANEALADLRNGRIVGGAVLEVHRD